MWQVLLAAAVAASTGLVAKHLFSPNADDPTTNTSPVPQHNHNPFDSLNPQVSLASTLGSPPVPSGCINASGNENGSSGQKQDGIFRFSSSGSPSRSGSRNSRKKAVGLKKVEGRSGYVEAEVPGKSVRRFAMLLKRRKTSKNVASKSGSSSTKDGFLFSWGLGVGIMYMMSAGKAEISKLNITMDETAKVVQDLKTELYKKRSSHHLHVLGSASEVDAESKKNDSKHTQLELNKLSTGNGDPSDIKVSGHTIIDDGECASSVLTEEPEPRVHEIDQLEAELESELQKLPWCITEASHQEGKPNLGETEVSAMAFREAEGQSLDSYQFHGVVPAVLDQKLCHLLIEQQEQQIEELESDLHLAQSKLNSKEAELQALKDCVRRLTAFSLATVSDDEAEAHEQQEQTGKGDYNKKTESESKKLLVGMKRPMDSESCGHCVR